METALIITLDLHQQLHHRVISIWLVNSRLWWVSLPGSKCGRKITQRRHSKRRQQLSSTRLPSKDTNLSLTYHYIKVCNNTSKIFKNLRCHKDNKNTNLLLRQFRKCKILGAVTDERPLKIYNSRFLKHHKILWQLNDSFWRHFKTTLRLLTNWGLY